jgi:hypothetical protein
MKSPLSLSVFASWWRLFSSQTLSLKKTMYWTVVRERVDEERDGSNGERTDGFKNFKSFAQKTNWAFLSVFVSQFYKLTKNIKRHTGSLQLCATTTTNLLFAPIRSETHSLFCFIVHIISAHCKFVTPISSSLRRHTCRERERGGAIVPREPKNTTPHKLFLLSCLLLPIFSLSCFLVYHRGARSCSLEKKA